MQSTSGRQSLRISLIRIVLFNFLADLKFPDFNMQAHGIVYPLKWTRQRGGVQDGGDPCMPVVGSC